MAKKPDEVSVQSFALGMNTRRPDFRLRTEEGFFQRETVNGDITADGTVRRRTGYEQELTGDAAHSLWSYGAEAFYADGPSLYRLGDVADELDVALVYGALRVGAPVSYAAAPQGGTFWTDGLALKHCVGAIVDDLAPERPALEPTVSIAAGYLPAGVYRYCFSYTDSEGLESPATHPQQIELNAAGGISFVLGGAVPAGLTLNAFVSPPNGADPNSLQVFFGEASSGNPGEVLLRHRGGSGSEVTIESGDNTMVDGSDYLVIPQYNSSTGNLELFAVAEGASVSAPNATAAQADPGLASATWDIGRRQDGNSARYSRYPIGEFFVLVGDRLSAAEVQTLAAGAHITAVRATRAVDLRFRGDNASESDLSGNGRNTTRNGTGYTLVNEFWPNASSITGTATPTLAALTSSSAGALQVKGASSPTLAALTAASASKLAIAGAGAPTLAALTVSATAVHTPIAGVAAVTLDPVTTSSAGKVAIAGAAAPTLSAVTSSSTGALPLVGTATPTLGALAMASVGALPIKATSTPILDPLALSATGSLALAAGTGAVTQTLGALTAISAAKVALAAAAAPTLGPLTSSATAALALKGSAGPTLAPVTLTATGELIVPSVRVGALNATLGDILAGGAGQIKLTGAVGATLASCALSAFGRSGLFVESLVRTVEIEAEDRVRAIELQNRRRIVSAAVRGNPMQ